MWHTRSPGKAKLGITSSKTSSQACLRRTDAGSVHPQPTFVRLCGLPPHRGSLLLQARQLLYALHCSAHGIGSALQHARRLILLFALMRLRPGRRLRLS